jgi:hypothetical protein
MRGAGAVLVVVDVRGRWDELALVRREAEDAGVLVHADPLVAGGGRASLLLECADLGEAHGWAARARGGRPSAVRPV